jgi:ubiquinone/menaquinone biosynthesis C-methylase UbiE
VPILRDSRQEGFVREFGMKLFDYMRANPAFGAVFNRAMTSYSAIQTQEVLGALAAEDFSRIRTLCDVGGGHGHLACALAQAYPDLNVTILDIPEVVGETGTLWKRERGFSER